MYSCGPACLHMMLKCYGVDFPEKEIIKYMDIDEFGTDWDQIREFFDDMEFSTTLYVMGKYESLFREYMLNRHPILISWNPEMEEYTDHYSVVSGVSRNNITLCDPGSGQFIILGKKYFIDRWYGLGEKSAYLVAEPKQSILFQE